MLLKNKYKEIKNFLDNNNILTEMEECYCYAEDSSNLIKSKKTPDIVVFAETIEEVQKILKYAYEHEIPVVSRGAGTNMVGSCVCNNGGIVLNFSKMNKILDIDAVDMTITVQPGVVLKDLKAEVDKKNLFFPPDPSNYAVSTIGGAIAQSSGGAFGFKYGTTKDYVLSLKVVTADGKLLQLGANTSKNSTGYHLSQLIVGSEGTLAIIVEAVLKLIPKPETMRAVSAYFDNIENAIDTVNKIVSSNLYPAAIDFMDNNSIKTVNDYTNCGLNTTKQCMLLIALDGTSGSVCEQTDILTNTLHLNGASEIKISGNPKEYEAIWNSRRVSFAATARLAPDVVTDDLIVPRKNLSKMVHKCRQIADKYNLKMCLVGHAGDGNIHPQIALNLEAEDEFKSFMNARAEMYEEAIALEGTISAEHGIGLEKKAYLAHTVDSNTIECMKMIKKVFDPKNILNPGKLL